MIETMSKNLPLHQWGDVVVTSHKYKKTAVLAFLFGLLLTLHILVCIFWATIIKQTH